MANTKETKAIVIMDGEEISSTDFVAVLAKENGDASISYNTDALTLGMALKMIAKEFVRCMNTCTEDERNEISGILGEAFIGDVEEDIVNA